MGGGQRWGVHAYRYPQNLYLHMLHSRQSWCLDTEFHNIIINYNMNLDMNINIISYISQYKHEFHIIMKNNFNIKSITSFCMKCGSVLWVVAQFQT